TVDIDSSDADFFRLGPVEGDVEVGGIVSLTSGNAGGDGGTFTASAGRNMTITATINVNGFDDGFEAGVANDNGSVGNILVQKNIDASGGSSNGTGNTISLAGCGLTVAQGVKINGSAGVNPATNTQGGSEIDLIAKRAMQLQANSQYLATPGGSILTIHPPGVTPVIDPTAVFNP